MSALSRSSLGLLYVGHRGPVVARSPKRSTPSSSPPTLNATLNDDDDWLVRRLLPVFLLHFQDGILHNPHEPTSTSMQLPYSLRILPLEVNDHSTRDGCCLAVSRSPT